PSPSVDTRSLHDALPICENQKLPAETPWMLSGVLPQNISSIGVEIYGSTDRSKDPLHTAVWSQPLDGIPTNFYIPVNYNLRSNTDRKSTRLNSSHVKTSY